MGSEQMSEWVRLMTEIAAADREQYRELRREAWERVAISHNEKSKEEREIWRLNAS